MTKNSHSSSTNNRNSNIDALHKQKAVKVVAGLTFSKNGKKGGGGGGERERERERERENLTPPQKKKTTKKKKTR